MQSESTNKFITLSKREKELEIGFKKIKELESQLENNINEIAETNKSKIYSDLENELRGIESDIRDIDAIANSLASFNHPVVLQVGGELTRAIKKLRERVDNNIIN